MFCLPRSLRFICSAIVIFQLKLRKGALFFATFNPFRALLLVRAFVTEFVHYQSSGDNAKQQKHTKNGMKIVIYFLREYTAYINTHSRQTETFARHRSFRLRRKSYFLLLPSPRSLPLAGKHSTERTGAHILSHFDMSQSTVSDILFMYTFIETGKNKLLFPSVTDEHEGAVRLKVRERF